MDETRIEEMATETRSTRRLVLRSALGIAAAGLTLTALAACGGEEEGLGEEEGVVEEEGLVEEEDD